MNKQDFVCVSGGKMGIAENAKNVPVIGASAGQFLLRKCCAKKCGFTSKKIWFSQERGNKFDYSRCNSAYSCAIFRVSPKFESDEIGYDCGTRDVKNPLRMLHSW